MAATGQDIFVLAENLNGAMHGDTVRVRISVIPPRGAEGIITSVLKRGIVRVAGTLRRKGKSAWLEPDDARVRGPIVLVSAADTKAGEGNSGNDGDAAVVRITRHPEMPNENPEGKFFRFLGKPGTLSAETMKILLVAGIDETHSDTAILEASAYGVEVPKEKCSWVAKMSPTYRFRRLTHKMHVTTTTPFGWSMRTTADIASGSQLRTSART